MKTGDTSARVALDESLDDLDARLGQIAIESRQWAAERMFLIPELWFVMRHSGRDGAPWRVLFESRSREEAEAFFERTAYAGKRRATVYATTRLLHGGLTWFEMVRSAGSPPHRASLITMGGVEAALAREGREAKAAKRVRPRVAVPTVEVELTYLRIVADVEMEDTTAVELEHEAASDQQPVRRTTRE